MGVQYFVEGSGQKIGNEIMLNIQLIEASSDRHLWAENYNRNTEDIFKLQKEIAKKIASQVQAIITPEEEKRLSEVPTKSIEAYDAYLKGRELFYKGDQDSYHQAISYYEQAIKLDPEFAEAYAGISISYYFLDMNKSEKQYADQINNFADKALLYGPQSPTSLVAKSLYYMHQGDYMAALPHLEKALEYNPNSALTMNLLSDFYTRFVPNTEKYLEYALKGARLDIASNDSTTASFIYLHISNAFIQSGFVEEAENYINKSIDYDPENLFSYYVKAYILYAKNRDFQQTETLLLETLSKDSTRLDVMQEVAKIYYMQRNYEQAYEYYDKYTSIKNELKLDIYPAENIKIAMVLRRNGKA